MVSGLPAVERVIWQQHHRNSRLRNQPPTSSPQKQLSTDGEVGCFPSIVSNPFSLLIDLACAVALLLFFFYAIPGRKVLALNLMMNDNLILPLPSLADL